MMCATHFEMYPPPKKNIDKLMEVDKDMIRQI